MNIKDIYTSTSNFLKVDDLAGNRVVVEIESFKVAEVGDEHKKQIVLTFKGKEKVLGLNKTNAEQIAQLTGTGDPNEWLGCKIKLKPAMTSFQGKDTPCIRISDEFFEAAPSRYVAYPAVGAPDDDDAVPF